MRNLSESWVLKKQGSMAVDRDKVKKLVLIDAMAILHRAFHAYPATLSTETGEVINAVYGFASILLTVL